MVSAYGYMDGMVELLGNLLVWFWVDELSVVIAAMLKLYLIHLEFCAE